MQEGATVDGCNMGLYLLCRGSRSDIAVSEIVLRGPDDADVALSVCLSVACFSFQHLITTRKEGTSGL